MENPSDGNPWLGLLVIDRLYHKLGYGKKLYEIYENEMKKRNVKMIRLGCFIQNERGYSFWINQGYSVYKTMNFKEKEMFLMEKVL